MRWDGEKNPFSREESRSRAFFFSSFCLVLDMENIAIVKNIFIYFCPIQKGNILRIGRTNILTNNNKMQFISWNVSPSLRTASWK